MHRSLRISEVVAMICSQLNPLPRAEGADLAALARTCTLFHDPALDVLWRHQNTLMNLIDCMPAGLWEIMNDPGVFGILVGPVLRCSRTIVASDWDRLLKYSHRVKFLQVRDNQGPDLTAFFEALRLGITDEYLLPNLQQLAWGYSSAASFGYAESVLPFIDLFLGPRITSIGIGPCKENAQYALLPDLARKYPSLSAVYIGYYDPDSDDDDNTSAEELDKLAGQLSAFVRALTCPQFLMVGTLDLAALIHVGQLETFELLHTRLPVSPSFPDVVHRSLFRRLRHTKLEIDNGDILALLQFVRTWNNAPLVALDVEFIGRNSARDFGSVFPQHAEEFHRILGEHCAPASLNKFRFHVVDGYDDIGTFIYPGHFLRQLFCFGNLVDVAIGVLDGFAVDDAVVTDLARAWPCLQKLSLTTERHQSAPQASLRSLQSLAQYCPELNTLAMTFDAIPAVIAGPENSQRKLVSLDAGYSLIATPLAVAGFLATTFPKLRKITADYGENLSRWAEVEKFVHGIRAQELLAATQDIAKPSAAVVSNSIA
ncbi:hypothetical protein DFH06DRAFT_1314240 [Mycena polygramma]|nr:hypothetical protein DFH06DRAFT_1314240 [Mycena polygramma]